MTNIKDQLLAVIKETKDDPNDIVCFYQPVIDYLTGNEVVYPGWNQRSCSEPIQCTIDELPTREFDAGYGSPNGEPTICFSPKYVYIRCQYDGSEWFEAVPRHPEYVTKPIPWLGG